MIDVNSLGVYTYFLIILSGFGFVWGYRKFGDHKPMSDFEYAGFSAFWGVIILGLYNTMMKDRIEEAGVFLSNPYTAGASLFVFSIALGVFIRWIFISIYLRLKR